MSVVVKSGCEKSEKVHKRKSNRVYCCPQMKCCTTECSPCPPPKCLSCPPKCPPCPPCPPKCSPCSPCPPCPPKCSPCSPCPPCPPVMECVPVCTTTALVQCPMIQGAVYWNGVKKTTCYSIVPACPAPSCCYYPYTPTGCS